MRKTQKSKLFSFNSTNQLPLACRGFSTGSWRAMAFACLFAILPAPAGGEEGDSPAKEAAVSERSGEASESSSSGPSYLSKAEAACHQLVPYHIHCKEKAASISFVLQTESGDQTFVPRDFTDKIQACAAFEGQNRLACLDALPSLGASAEAVKACGLFRRDSEVLCLESLEAPATPLEKIHLCPSKRGYALSLYINYKARKKWDPDKSQDEGNGRLIPISYAEENEAFCLKMAARPEVSAEEIQACAAFKLKGQPNCLQKAAELDLDPEKTQACGFYEGEGGPAHCLHTTHGKDISPEQIFACNDVEDPEACLRIVSLLLPAPEGREASCQSLDDSQSCLSQLEEPFLSAKEIKTCGFLDDWDAQIGCLEKSAAASLNAEEIQACGLSGLSRRSQALCLEKAALPDLSAEEIKACGEMGSEEEALCLEMAGEPALTLDEIRACGAANLGAGAGLCLERASRPKPALEDIIECGRLLWIDEAACLRKAQEQFLLSEEEKDACGEHFEEEDSCLSAAGLFNPGLEKILACGAFYNGADELLCLQKAAAPSLTAEEIRGCAAGDFSGAGKALCLETAQELSFGFKGLQICGAFHSENELPCLDKIRFADHAEAKQRAKACAGWHRANEMACLALAIEPGRDEGESRAVSLEELRACGSLSFDAKTERLCLDEARKRPLSMKKTQACAAAAASSLPACLRESANPLLLTEKIQACASLPPNHQNICFDLAGGGAKKFELSSHKIRLCKDLFSEELLPLCLESAAGAGLKKMQACGETGIEDKKTCLESISETEITVRKIQLCAVIDGGELESLCLKNASRFELDGGLTACLKAKTEEEQKNCLQSKNWLPRILKILSSLGIPEAPDYD